MREVWAERLQQAARGSEVTEAATAELTQRRSRIFELREEGAYSKDIFEERLRTVDSQLFALKQSFIDAPTPHVPISSVIAAVRWLCSNVAAMWRDFPPAARARLERFVLPEGVCFDHADGVRTTKVGLIFALVSDLRPTTNPRRWTSGSMVRTYVWTISSISLSCTENSRLHLPLIHGCVTLSNVPDVPMSTRTGSPQ